MRNKEMKMYFVCHLCMVCGGAGMGFHAVCTCALAALKT